MPSLTEKPQSWIVFGPSGCGKTTVGQALARRLGLAFHDADAYHPKANVAKMSRGEPLTDEDRGPWLERLIAMLRDESPVVLACSALKRAYRVRLDAGVEVRWVLLDVDRATLAARMTGRNEAGTHFMPRSLLDSQLAALERPGPDENVLVLDARLPVEQLVDSIMSSDGHPA